MKFFIGLFLSSLLILTLLSCRNGFAPSSQDTNCVGSQCSQSVDPKVDVVGYISGGAFDNKLAVDYVRIEKKFAFRLPLPTNPFLTAQMGSINEIPGATWEIVQENNKWVLLLKIPLQVVLKGVTQIPPARLPNGDPLAGIPSGELPRVAVQVAHSNKLFYLYANVEMVALFVPTPGFDPYFAVSYPIKNRSEQRVLGYFATVPEKQGFAGGFYLSVVIPDSIARAIDR